MCWTYTRRVKYYETDRMGVVHHSNYLRIIEDARMEWLRDNVMSYSEMENLGIIIPAVSAAGKFLSFLHFDDPFTIMVKLTKFVGVKMEFFYQICNSNTGELCYEGESAHFLAYGEQYRPFLSIRKKYPEIYNKLVLLSNSD